MSQLIEEINRLARLSRERPLNEEEQKKQDELRKHYLIQFRAKFKQQLSQIQGVNSKGHPVTPQTKKIEAAAIKKRGSRLI